MCISVQYKKMIHMNEYICIQLVDFLFYYEALHLSVSLNYQILCT